MFASRERKTKSQVQYLYYSCYYRPEAFSKSKDSNERSLSDSPSLRRFEKRIPHAEKGRHEHKRVVNEVENCSIASEVLAKENMVKAARSEIKLSLQQKNKRAAIPSTFTT